MTKRFIVLAVSSVLFAHGVPTSAQPTEDQRAKAHAAYVAGDHVRAEEILERLIAANSGDADLLRRFASVLAARGDFARASLTIDRAMAIAPDDFDIQLARANILLWQGRHRDARRQASTIFLKRPNYPGLSETIAAIHRAEEDNRIRLFAAGVGGSISHVEFPEFNNQSWTVVNGSVAISVRPRVRAAFDVEREERAAVDTRLSTRIDLLYPSGSAYVFGSATPNADFRESWSVGGGGERAIGSRTTALLDARYASYRFEAVGVIGAGLRQQLGRNLAFTARTISLLGGGKDYRFGGSLRLDYAPDDDFGGFVATASYPDTEADGTAQVRALSAGARIPMGRRLTLRLTADHEKRERSYRRSTLAIGLGWRFASQ